MSSRPRPHSRYTSPRVVRCGAILTVTVMQLWDVTGQRRKLGAHGSLIAALAWQPLQSPIEDHQDRLLASGAEDGTLTIWNVREGRSKWSMDMGLPVIALAFTPDGAFIAGGTTERVLIWKVGEHVIPRASWTRLPHPRLALSQGREPREFRARRGGHALPVLGYHRPEASIWD